MTSMILPSGSTVLVEGVGDEVLLGTFGLLICIILVCILLYKMNQSSRVPSPSASHIGQGNGMGQGNFLSMAW